MLPIADPQAEAHGSIEKNKPLTISFFHSQSHPRGSKLHCISGEIHARIYPLDRKFKAQTASYDSFLLGLLLYGVLTTVFTAVRSEAFVSDFKTFFMVIWQFIVNVFQLLLKGGQWASQLGDKIPQPVVATIVHYLLLIVFVGGIAIGVGFLIFLGASKVFEFYTED